MLQQQCAICNLKQTHMWKLSWLQHFMRQMVELRYGLTFAKLKQKTPKQQSLSGCGWVSESVAHVRRNMFVYLLLFCWT